MPKAANQNTTKSKDPRLEGRVLNDVEDKLREIRLLTLVGIDASADATLVRPGFFELTDDQTEKVTFILWEILRRVEEAKAAPFPDDPPLSMGSGEGASGPLAESASDIASSDDVELVDTAWHLIACDTALSFLCDSSPEDAEKIPGWLELDEKRTDYIAILSETPAVGVNGIRAKAVALKRNSVQDCEEEAGSIAGMLADDIISIFGAEM